MVDPTKRDDYTRDRFRWLDQVVADPQLPAAAFKVAYAIATSLKRNSGTVTLVSALTGPDDDVREAWIGCRDIADMIGMSFATVAAMADRLQQQGHIEMDRGKRGRGHAHHYRLVIKDHPAEQLKDQPAEHSQKTKDHPAEHLDREKISRLHTKDQPAEQNPSVPLRKTIEERESPQPQFDLEEDGRREVSLSSQPDNTDADFENWYLQYPKHVDKADARKAYLAVIKKKLATPEQLMAGAVRYAAERAVHDPRYTKNPATWLNKQSWLNEPAQPIGTTYSQPESPHIARAARIARQLQAEQGGDNVVE